MHCRFSIYRYHPETDKGPRMQDFELRDVAPDTMLLEALEALRRQDETLTFRSSCGEGVCGSDGMNVNGRNVLACITPVAQLRQPIAVRPLSALPVIRDLVVDLSNFWRQYRETRPWVVREDPLPELELRQSPEDRERLDGLYECILCACCSSACPSYWWNPERFLGPAALLQACRFIEDSRDQDTGRRLDQLDDAYRLFRCHTIMNCTDVCPKGLNPSRAIGRIRERMLKQFI